MDVSDACVSLVSSKAVSESLSAVIWRQSPCSSIWSRTSWTHPLLYLRFSCGSAASQCRSGNFYIRTIFIFFEDLSGFFFIILFVLHQVAHGGIGVPFRVGLSRLDLMLKYLRFYFRYRSMSIIPFTMLLPASVKELLWWISRSEVDNWSTPVKGSHISLFWLTLISVPIASRVLVSL